MTNTSYIYTQLINNNNKTYSTKSVTDAINNCHANIFYQSTASMNHPTILRKQTRVPVDKERKLIVLDQSRRHFVVLYIPLQALVENETKTVGFSLKFVSGSSSNYHNTIQYTGKSLNTLYRYLTQYRSFKLYPLSGDARYSEGLDFSRNCVIRLPKKTPVIQKCPLGEVPLQYNIYERLHEYVFVKADDHW